MVAGAGDAGLNTFLLVVLVIEATISGKDLGRQPKRVLVIVQCGFHMIFIGRVALQNAVLGDQAVSTFG